MFIGIALGTTSSNGAYVDIDGSVRQIINANLPEITPVNLNCWFEGYGNLLNAEKALKELTAIIAGMKYSLENYSCEGVDGAVVCLPAKLPSRADMWNWRMERKYLEKGEDAKTEAEARDMDGRELLEEAVQQAGIHQMETLKESVAVVYAYGIECMTEGEIALVYDLGGENFTATLIQKRNGELAVLAERAAECGGNELDMMLLEDATHKMEENLTWAEITRDDPGNQEAWAQFDTGVGRVKRQLGRCGTADLVFRNPMLKVTCEYPWERFEPFLSQLYQQTEMIVIETIADAGIQKKDIANVFLAGGSSHFPYIREQLERFTRKPVHVLKDMTAASAIGAAIYAETYIDTRKDKRQQFAK